MKWLQWATFFVVGYVAGFGTLLALFLAYGNYAAEPISPSPVAAVVIAPTVVPATTGPSYEAVCKADTNNMTDPQITAFAKQWVGQRFSGWHGWVYDVVSRSDGTYNLEIAMQERGLLWSRNIVVENIASGLALRLNVEQPIVLSGRVARNEQFLDGICNPLVVEDFSLQE